MTHLSVVVTGGSPTAIGAQRVMTAWAEAGLVRELLWVTTDDIDRNVEPPVVMATVIGREGSVRGDLFREVGLRSLETVRLVVAQVLAPGAAPNPELAAAGREIATLLDAVLPRAGAGGSGAGTRLRKANLLVPASGTAGIAPSALLPGWDVNAVVAPEDRPDLDRASVFVRDGVNFVGHAASAIASVAALWPGIDQGAVDALESDSTTTERDVVVARCAVRAIVRDGTGRGIADAACARILEDPAEPSRVVDWARPAQDPTMLIETASAHVVGSGDWVARTPTPTPSPRRGEKALGAAFREAAIFNLRLFGLGAKALVGMGTRAFERAATSAIVGSAGDYVIRLRPGSSRALVRVARERLEAQSVELRSRMLLEEAAAVPAPNPSTWVELRRWSFGLVDGSPLPDGFEIPALAGKPQLLPPAAIVPRPDDFFHPADGGTIRACDARAALAYQAELEERLEPPADAAAIDVPPGEGPGARTSGGAKLSDEEEAAVREELARLQAWVDARSGSLLWRVAEHAVRTAQSKEQVAVHAQADAVRPAVPPEEQLRRAQRELVVGWSVLAAVLAGTALYLWRVPRLAGLMTQDQMWLAIGATALVLLVIGVLLNHRYYRAVRHFLWMVEEALAHRRRTAESYIVARRESRRLAVLTSRFNEWAEIIGTVLHRPWQQAPPAPPQIPVDRLEELPAAVAVAVPSVQEAHVKPVVLVRAIQVLSAPGWATQNFDHAIDAYERHVRHARDGGHLAADLDTLDSDTSPLRLLWAFFVEGDAGRFAAQAARERVSEAVAAGALELPPTQVVRKGAYAEGGPVQEAEFLQGVVGPATPFVKDMWTPSGLVAERQIPVRSLVWLRGGPGGGKAAAFERRPASGDVAMRVDLSSRCTPDDLALFGRPADVEVRTEPVARPVSDFN